MHCSTSQQRTITGRRARGQRGQALIIAVLVMLVLAALAGLFIVVVSWGLAQSVTEAERIGAQYLAEAGIRFAADQLVFGPEGADWRPPVAPGEWAEYPYGEGKFRLRVTYAPSDDDPMSKYIKIEAEGRRSAARYRLVSYARILLTDFLRFVTNSDKSVRRAQLGAAYFVYTTDEEGIVTQTGPYKGFWNGPMQFNCDLEFFGPQQMNLAVQSPPDCAALDDVVACSRFISQGPRWGAENPDVHTLEVQVGGSTYRVGPTVQDGTFETAEGHYRDGVVTYTGAGGFSRAAAYYEAPMLDQGSRGTAGHRYHVLTRDSGEWRGQRERRYNTGWYGYGDGIYIDNFGDMEDISGYEAWRQKWAEAAATGVYPGPAPAVTIWLHPEDTNGDGLPDLTIQRDDTAWRDPDDPSRLLGPVVTLPYPKNGVIFAESNIRIGGVMPRASYRIAYKPDSPYPGYWNSDGDRRYDLTVVSGGTIYIEGTLSSEGYRDLDGRIDRTSKIALLALENVCLDATKVLRPIGTAVVEPGATEVARIRPGESYGVEFSTVGMTGAEIARMEICLRHAGTYVRPGYWTQVQLLIDGRPYEWGDHDTYRMYVGAPWADDSAPVIRPQWEVIPCTETDPWTGTTVVKDIKIGTYLDPETSVHRIEFVAPPSASGAEYQLFDLGIQPLTTRVDALMYAQRGSWYVLAGPPFDMGSEEDQGRLPEAVEVIYRHEDGRPGFPRPLEPLDINLVISGAISENRTAPVGDVATWTQRWRAADEWWLADGVDASATHGLQYRYDPYLRLNVGANRPRLPRLPVSPVLISAEETAL